MQQPEKQKTLLLYIKKNYAKAGFEIKEAVKDTVKFFTPDQSIVLKCKNNGEVIITSTRMRRGKKHASGGTKRAETEPVPKKAAPSIKLKVKKKKFSDTVKPVQSRQVRRSPAEETGSIIADHDDQEKITSEDPIPAPFFPGESVELIYGNHPAYTVVSTDRNICRVVTSAGERIEYNIAAADLRKSKKPPRKEIEEQKIISRKASS